MFAQEETNMFDRFTDRAREVLKLAREEAQKLNHGYMGTEHLLLGLLAEGKGVAATVLNTLKVDENKVRDEVSKIVGKGVPEDMVHGSLPFTPRGKKALELATEEASTLKHHYVGTEHLLLGLIREHDGVAAQALMSVGLKLEEVRAEVLEHVGAHTVGAAAALDESYEREFKNMALGYAVAYARPGADSSEIENNVERMWRLQQEELRQGKALRFKPGEDPLAKGLDSWSTIKSMFEAGAKKVAVDKDPQRPGMYRIYSETPRSEQAAAPAEPAVGIGAGEYGSSVAVTLMFSDEAHREAWLAKNGFFEHKDPRRVEAKKLDYQRRRGNQNLFYVAGPVDK